MTPKPRPLPFPPIPSSNPPAATPSTTHFQLWTVNSRLFCSKPFRFTYFRKNASVTPLGTHTSKTKDLKPFRITYLQKMVGGGGYIRGKYDGPPITGDSVCFGLSTFNYRLSIRR